MILVRQVFETEWGKSQEVVEMFKQGAEMLRRNLGATTRVRLLTDLSGPFHIVVQEIEAENLGEWERTRAAIFSDPEWQQMTSRRPPPFRSGHAEFYTIESTLEP